MKRSADIVRLPLAPPVREVVARKHSATIVILPVVRIEHPAPKATKIIKRHKARQQGRE